MGLVDKCFISSGKQKLKIKHTENLLSQKHTLLWFQLLLHVRLKHVHVVYVSKSMCELYFYQCMAQDKGLILWPVIVGLKGACVSHSRVTLLCPYANHVVVYMNLD